MLIILLGTAPLRRLVEWLAQPHIVVELEVAIKEEPVLVCRLALSR